MPREVKEVRGIPLWLLREYLVEDGGESTSDDLVVGAGWTVRLTQMEDFQIGSIRVGEVRLEIEGRDAESLARIQAILEPKLLRAGG